MAGLDIAMDVARANPNPLQATGRAVQAQTCPTFPERRAIYRIGEKRKSWNPEKGSMVFLACLME